MSDAEPTLDQQIARALKYADDKDEERGGAGHGTTMLRRRVEIMQDVKAKLEAIGRYINENEVNVGLKDGKPVIRIQSEPGYYMSVCEAVDAAKKDEERG